MALGRPTAKPLSFVVVMGILTGSFLFGAGCERLIRSPSGQLDCPETPAKAVWLVTFGHSQSDQAEEPDHLRWFKTVFLPRALGEYATVVVVTVGAQGFTSPRVLAKANFDTSMVDGENPKLRERMQARCLRRLLDGVEAGLRGLPFSPVSDPFGGFAAAASMLAQYPAVPKRLVALGDELATTPTGCVLAVRDPSLPHRDRLIEICSSAIPDLRDVEVMLPGAGFSLDDPIPTATAQGLEQLFRDFFARTGASLTLYGPVALTAGSDSGGGSS